MAALDRQRNLGPVIFPMGTTTVSSACPFYSPVLAASVAAGPWAAVAASSWMAPSLTASSGGSLSWVVPSSHTHAHVGLVVPCGHVWCNSAADAVAAGCHLLGLWASDEPNLQREWYVFAVGRVDVDANVSGGVGHVPTLQIQAGPLWLQLCPCNQQ